MSQSNAQEVALSATERERMFNAIYAKTHPDFKGHYDGTKTLISYAKFGGGLASAATMSDAELRERFSDVSRKK